MCEPSERNVLPARGAAPVPYHPGLSGSGRDRGTSPGLPGGIRATVKASILLLIRTSDWGADLERPSTFYVGGRSALSSPRRVTMNLVWIDFGMRSRYCCRRRHS